MSTWATLLLAAVIAAVVGTVAGTTAARQVLRGTSWTTWLKKPTWLKNLRPQRPPAVTRARSVTAVPPAPTRAMDAGLTPRPPDAKSTTTGVHMKRTPVLESQLRGPDDGLARLRISTGADDTVYRLTNEGLTLGPRDADIVAPELATQLVLGRSGSIWTVLAAGSADPGLSLDGVPLTSVPMPWTSGKTLNAGRLTLEIENAPPAEPAFEEPAAHVSSALTDSYAIQAGPYAIAIANSSGRDAFTLGMAALAGFDPRMLDPARAAAQAAINVTLAIRDAARSMRGETGWDPLRVAIFGVDARGELRVAANLDVCVWAVTQAGLLLLSAPRQADDPSAEIVPLEIAPAPVRGERPVLLVTANLPPAAVAGCLAGATPKTPPEEIARLTASIPDSPGVAGAAILARAPRGGVARAHLSRAEQAPSG